ncbi:MAG: FMN-binding negative transcriptional regulator [Raineya sp.]|jgi:transcriptional regulator|nr:FMN-binding negative transcriptional regulator [Raineya sp.]
MYIPNNNQITDFTEKIEFIKKYSFGVIISTIEDVPVATHLPFFVSHVDEKIILMSHFAKANPQWKNIENSTVLLIFSEPHAYISPTNYEKELNVPTWNYVSIHVYGKVQIIIDEEKVLEVLEKTIDYYEPTYQKQWESLPNEYKKNMLKGIVAFEIVVTDIQGKKKLSQNKTEKEQNNIIEALSKSKFTHEQDIAAFMKKELSE